MPNNTGRDALRGAEGETIDLIFENSSSEQWADLLKGPLERAVGQGNRDLAQKLARAGAEIGTTLHAAVRGGHGQIANDLLENGAPLNGRGLTGETPLSAAATRGNTSMVQFLLLKGADKDVMDNDGRSPLYLSAAADQHDAALALIAAGADVRRPMHMAAKRGHVGVLRALIEHGADVNADDPHVGTALRQAATFNQFEAIDVLVEAGANIEARDDDGATPLHFAIDNRCCEAAVALLKHGADVNARDHTDRTPLYDAVHTRAGMARTSEMVELLLRSRADERIADVHGRAAVDRTVEAPFGPHNPSPEEAKRIKRLLANAPADRAWRRRGYLVMCRAHPDRMQSRLKDDSSAHDGVTRRAHSAAKVEGGGGIGTVRNSTEEDKPSGDWAEVVTSVLGLEEEGIFRTIVGYL